MAIASPSSPEPPGGPNRSLKTIFSPSENQHPAAHWLATAARVLSNGIDQPDESCKPICYKRESHSL
jgi:hypothetical protein